MAISSIRDVLGDIQEEKLKRLLENYIHKHEEYGEELHALLSANQSPPEEPKASAKTMAKVVTCLLYTSLVNRHSAVLFNGKIHSITFPAIETFSFLPILNYRKNGILSRKTPISLTREKGYDT